ncbi:MAG: hypothetical protein AB7H77_07245 [Bdellovibrionales bacterium]
MRLELFAEPQTAFAGLIPEFVLSPSAVQLAVEPPFSPEHVHDQGPAPATEEGVPLLHSPVDGREENVEPFAEPHVPLLPCTCAEQLADTPPF